MPQETEHSRWAPTAEGKSYLGVGSPEVQVRRQGWLSREVGRRQEQCAGVTTSTFALKLRSSGEHAAATTV